MQANAASVPCDLGGGNYGHLGLVLTHVEYANATPKPYVIPVYLNIVNIAIGPPNYEETRLCDENKK